MSRFTIASWLLFPLLGAFGAEVKSAQSSAPLSSDGTYELRGFFGKDDNLEVSLRDSRNNSARWFRVGKKFGGMVVEKADAKSGTATLWVAGVRRELRLAVEVLPPFVVPSTQEEFDELKKQIAELNSGEVGAKIEKLQRDLADRFHAEHPEYDELLRRIMTTPDSPERRVLVARCDILTKQWNDMRTALVENSGDSDLVEDARLQAALLEVRRRLPSKPDDGNDSPEQEQPAEDIFR